MLENFIICDPYVGNVIAEYASISEHNLKKLEIKSRPGVWYAYHFYGNNRHPVALILVEESYHFKEEIRNIQLSELTEQGKVISAFGQMVSAVDKQVLNNTMYTYIRTSEDLVYRIKDVRKWINDTKPPKEKQLKALLENLEQQGERFVDCKTLLPLCSAKRIPVESDIWASDCYYRLRDNPIHATVILSGVISKAYSDVNTVYTNSKKDCQYIYIDLDEQASKAPAIRIIK